MEHKFYLETFQKAADQIEKEKLSEKELEVSIGDYKNSIFLKLYKKTWANPGENPLTSETRIFFSIWINIRSLGEQKLYYNIHAFKLRKLKGYSIESRKFATSFRESFKKFQQSWENVSVDFGPLTLMEGWLKIDLENFQNQILEITNQFFEIDFLIDDTLNSFKKR